MSDGSRNSVHIDDVVGILELGVAITSFLKDVVDLRNAALVSKRFNRAAACHLWRAIRLPHINCLPGSANQINKLAAWNSLSPLLEHHTVSLFANMSTIHPENLNKITARQWGDQARDREGLSIKIGLDVVFDALAQTLTRAPRLRNFEAQEVPRVLDIMRVLQWYCADSIEAITITASSSDTFGLRALPTINKDHLDYKRRVNTAFTVPLANTINVQAKLSIKPVFSFQSLRILTLHNLQYDGRSPSSFVAPLVSILRGARNLTHLELSLRHQIGGMTIDGEFVQYLYGDPDHLEKIIIRIAKPFPSDWERDENIGTGYQSWIKPEQLKSHEYRSVRLHGLIWPTEDMSPEDSDHVLQAISHIQQLSVLKIRMPRLAGGKNKPAMRKFWKNMAKFTSLRELWLADALNELAATFARRCQNLAYLRILSHAWLITRIPGLAAPQVVQLARNHEMPDTFHWATPVVV
ncbi:hypothetical protein NEMBOFW57_010020 [Staphylotrichum longicolle]|uniref:F-box domain-containing protein n=1 Tax=Staphylotrichum longicolle TaxID=669026 RepID=A0AAD4HY95_9PEZI|nr:hypothetical protein NEMBOFW57_010020 [Staphylotrichum longicolle]